MKNKLISFYGKMKLNKRLSIETINHMLKNSAQVVRSRLRFHQQLDHKFSALDAYCFFDNKHRELQINH